ncbi:alpha/beta fold hydrolase [Nocardia sp. ET3-3]|uniref:Alpha/beta fold hydrolase n=1 Tax=Nocardia terrae TaxID=2675851 RepID=A0A7K1V3V1_9NOCA|nr:alpha/beta hydrolase [Nocardia terrae]MVU81172.1 alpha/beta fold hydrolase [Nocardia terrae]
MNAIEHRTVIVNGLPTHLAESGSGPLVILLHGFPELWYSWRHQLPALAAAGYHAVAPDLRGHGRTAAPPDAADYGMAAYVDDVLGLLDVLGESTAVLVGHDWGMRTAWAAAESHPARFPAIVALSVPHQARTPAPPTEQLRAWARDRLNWMLYFQEPVADSDLSADVARTLRLMLYGLSGDAGELGVRLLTTLPADAVLLDEIPEPPGPLPWLSDADLSYYVSEYQRTGFRGGLNRYRNADRDWHRLPTLGTGVLPQPTLFAGGAYDTAVRFNDLSAMRTLVPNLHEPMVIPGCGHWIQQERPDEINEAVLAFLDKVG